MQLSRIKQQKRQPGVQNDELYAEICAIVVCFPCVNLAYPSSGVGAKRIGHLAFQVVSPPLTNWIHLWSQRTSLGFTCHKLSSSHRHLKMGAMFTIFKGVPFCRNPVWTPIPDPVDGPISKKGVPKWLGGCLKWA